LNACDTNSPRPGEIVGENPELRGAFSGKVPENSYDLAGKEFFRSIHIPVDEGSL
jgi:hypothetical protein